MKGLSTRQVAKLLGLSHAALVRYMADGKIPTPKTIQFGGFRAHLWTEEEIEHVRQLLPKIANGRKTRYQKLRQKQDAQTGAPQPQRTKSARAGGPKAVPHKQRKTKKK